MTSYTECSESKIFGGIQRDELQYHHAMYIHRVVYQTMISKLYHFCFWNLMTMLWWIQSRANENKTVYAKVKFSKDPKCEKAGKCQLKRRVGQIGVCGNSGNSSGQACWWNWHRHITPCSASRPRNAGLSLNQSDPAAGFYLITVLPVNLTVLASSARLTSPHVVSILHILSR